ncbi:LPXTG cell wall anchor domain-containing protein [Glycomyces tritici]|uniref:LPXTG cell wall anchor domain-containing protein n=1 Tax=Glycomyces tritici TaxID=2665176 RepID=A0ABT7YPS9_9ACTN|nr:LPXTG cell wall anchor domain-containing protein [Glycomyces tritici]MDN3240651.1 LPXTG cell wall anchor domain-containing protein [Glycomyces tritici]
MLTVAGAAGLAVAAFASPAAAQTPEVESTIVEDYSPVTVGDEPTLAIAQIIFTEAFPAGHTLTALITIDAPDGTFAIENDDDDDCAPNAAGTVVECTADAAESVSFDYNYAAVLEAEPGDYEYTVEFKVDGTTVATADDVIEVSAHSVESFRYGHGQVEVEPGGTADTAPSFIQTDALPAGTAALAYGVSEPGYIMSGLAEASAPYENCVDGYWNGDGGVTCIVTDFEDKPGTTFAPDSPISFSVGETVPGPFDVCGCGFEVRPLTAAELEDEYGDVDTETGDQLGFETVSEGDDPDDFGWAGYIDVRTTENPFDLSVADANAKGKKGDEVTLTVPVKNLGPADAASFFDGPGSYGIIGSLPKGLELVEAGGDGDDLSCFEPDDPMVEHSFPQVDPAKTDFVCFFWSVGAGESFDFEFTVKITDAASKAKGTLTVAAIDDEGYPGIADADAKNDTADITVNGTGSGNGNGNGNGGGSGKLPKTGTSMGMIVGVAALVLVAGIVLTALTARRRKAGAAGAIEE